MALLVRHRPGPGWAARRRRARHAHRRLHELTTEPAHAGNQDLPPDPADTDTNRPDDLDQLRHSTDPTPTDPADTAPADADPIRPDPAEAEQAGPAAGDQPPTTSRQRLLELNEAAASRWAQQYPGSPAAGYVRSRLGDDLADDPGVSVGYAPAGWTNLVDHLRHTHRADDTELVDAGLAKWSRRGTLIDLMRDRVVFGIRDSDGTLVGFAGRAAPGADPKAPKWLNAPTTPIFTKGQLLFGLAENQDRLTAGATPVRVEGVFDALALAVTLAGDGQAVGLAPLGTALTAAHANLLAKAARDQLVVYGADDDSAGMNPPTATTACSPPAASTYAAWFSPTANAPTTTPPTRTPPTTGQHYVTCSLPST